MEIQNSEKIIILTVEVLHKQKVVEMERKIIAIMIKLRTERRLNQILKEKQ